MDAILISQKQNLNRLRDFLRGIKLHHDLLKIDTDIIQDRLIKKNLEKHNRFYLNIKTEKALLDYTTVTVNLYSSFEQFIEGMIMAYLSHINNIIPKFNELPDNIKKVHSNLSAQLLLNLHLQKYHGITTENDIIHNLYTCTKNLSGYKLNTLAFAHHSSNFRVNSINEIFSHVIDGSISQMIKLQKIFKNYINKLDPALDLNRTKNDVIFEQINDLAYRRNEISHGAPSQILSIQLLEERIDFIDVYCQSMHDAVIAKILPFIVAYKASHLSNIITIINHNIICAEVENITVSVGDTIISKSSHNRYRHSKIESIEVDNESFEKIDAKQKVEIGMKVNFYAKDNHEFFHSSLN
ncbi:MAE_28990/MAE_18760 family HEPN-like nuclease [Desulfobacterales bacterium HSG16]|nr:MAE_28990/MAE_18760 family HEPN-like nuclease [Desulfobacterales bacterium HSG16]